MSRTPDLRATRCFVALAAAVALTACGVEEVIMEPFRGETPHERYAEALEKAGLGDAELARSWSRAASQALRAPVEAVLPKEEVGRFGPEEPMALGYRMELRRGQRVRIRLDVDSPGFEDELRVFLEVFRVRGSDEEPQLLKVAWAEPEERTLEYEARTTATHVLRVQPELLAGGTYRLLVGIEPSLAFPVEGVDAAAIRSFFGASRDGGRREHHGVDIFAPRGTPVLAASEGVVRRVGTNRLGGNVVWIRDEERGISQYYAHLDTQLVVGGIRVSPGDTLGLVGNTGNARTTPPHLHFGLYVRGEGPVDPFPFLHDPGGGLSPLEVDPAAFREVRRIVESGASVLAGASARSSTLAVVEVGDSVRVLGGSGGFFRVRLSDGRHGYAAPSLLQELPAPAPDLPATEVQAEEAAPAGS